MTDKQIATPRPEIAVPLELLDSFTWTRLFANPLPVELEIGTGKGTFLLRRARQVPDRNLLGIEWANEFYQYACDRFSRWNLQNVRMLRTDASDFVQRICPRDSLTVLHVYHPDPWPKRRHNKRRLFQPRFIEAAIDCLIVGGRWAVQTDHAEYFSVIEPLLANNARLKLVPFSDPTFGTEGEGVATNFELKYRKEGRAIYQIAVVRTA